MKIKTMNHYVDDQERALGFYTNKLGFLKKADFTQGNYRWLTVSSAEEPAGVELVLQASAFLPAAQTYQRALHEQGIPAAMFLVDDLSTEYERLKGLGVAFTKPPTKTTGSVVAILDDTCGNFIQLTQLAGA
jgi:predicted enzyme related to lactoylglutathione lyase